MNILPTVSKPSAPFCRFSVADQSYVESILAAERSALLQQIDVYKEYGDALKDQLLQATLNSVTSETYDLGPEPDFLLEEPGDVRKFYQEEHGRLIFLDPLSNDMIGAQFGSVDDGPEFLEFDAIHRRTITVDQAVRRRYKCLGHLPAGASVEFVLADLSAIVSDKVMKRFADQISRRIEQSLEEFGESTDPRSASLAEADFPALGAPTSPVAGNPVAGKKVSAWSAVKPRPVVRLGSEEEFPALGDGRNMPKRKSSWGGE
jgi:hypothetical protein